MGEDGALRFTGLGSDVTFATALAYRAVCFIDEVASAPTRSVSAWNISKKALSARWLKGLFSFGEGLASYWQGLIYIWGGQSGPFTGAG